MREAPELSLIIPVYNRRRFLRAAVSSALLEMSAGMEILIIDDGSTDGSLESVRDLPVRLFRLDRNRGQAAAQNFGLQKALGRYVTFLDSDDLLAPGGLQRRLSWMSGTMAEIVAGKVAGIIDEEGNALGSFEECIDSELKWPRSQFSREDHQRGKRFPSFSWLSLYRKSYLIQMGGFDESLVCAHDNDLLLRILKDRPLPFIDVPVAFYRVHADNMAVGRDKKGIGLSRRALGETLLVHLSHNLVQEEVKC
jgi:glycosyltransferase involved in cell wall biosynthesis